MLKSDQPATSKKKALALLNKGHIDESKKLLSEVIISMPGDAEAWFFHGAICGQQGLFDEAIASCRRAIKLKPDYLEARYNLAQACMQVGRVEEAVSDYRLVVQQKPDYAVGYNQLGHALQRVGNYAEAIECHERALQLEPAFLEAMNNRGIALKALGRTEDAIAAFRQAIRGKHDYAEAHFNLGAIFQTQQEFTKAKVEFQAAIRYRPGYANACNNLGSVYAELGEYTEAVDSFRLAIEYQPDLLEAKCNLAQSLASTSRLDEALDVYQDITNQSADNADALAGIAGIFEKQGQYRKAYDILLPLIESGARHVDLVTTFARICRHFDRCEEAISLLETTVAGDDISNSDRRVLHFTLGNVCDSVGKFNQAYTHFRAGNELKRDRFSIRSHKTYISTLINQFSSKALAQMPRANTGSRQPVFIVGMPRSGTSLAEQIIASHPQVFGAGELDNMTNLVAKLPPQLNGGQSFVERKTQFDCAMLDGLAQGYLDHLAAISDGALRVTDKMPHNFLHLGIIDRLFPQGRVIHCVRNPLDTCLSCYFNDFGSSHPYAYKLDDLGAYYLEYERLMAHWKSVLTIPVFELKYEDLVANQEETSRAMIDFCGLEWDERCLSFHKTGRFVNTISYDQVRRPMYSRSIDRWKNYHAYLESLGKTLSVKGR